MEHYFIEKEHNIEDFFDIEWSFLDNNFVFRSCDSVFSKNEVDYGTYVLLKTISKKVELKGNILDMGCGYGPIGIVLAKLNPNATITMADINKTAVELSKHNCKKNDVQNIKNIIESNCYENIQDTFDFIISNPPIKAGKQVLLEITMNSYEHLKENGKLIFVIKKKFGEDSLKKKLQTKFKTVEVINRDSGYYILLASK